MSNIVIKFNHEIPTEGQFIVVWEYAGELWSETLGYNSENQLVVWRDERDGWERYSLSALSEVNIIGFYSRK